MFIILSKTLDALEKIEKVFIALASVIMTTSMFYQVIMRYIFSNANAWSEELARYLLIYVIMFGATIAIRKGGHLQVDFLINSLKPKAKCIWTISCTLLGAVFLIYFLYYSIGLVGATTNSISAGLKIPMSYVYAAIPAGSILMLLASIELIFKQIQEYKRLNVGEGTLK